MARVPSCFCHSTRFFKEHTLPAVDDVDFIIAMGGPMSVNNESVHRRPN